MVDVKSGQLKKREDAEPINVGWTQNGSKLSFSGSTSMWAPSRGGNWAEQNARGRRYAEELMALITETENMALLGAVVADMRKTPQADGVEAGFWYRISLRIV